MYDPLVVDTFIRVHRTIEPSSIEIGPHQQVLNEIAGARNNTSMHTLQALASDINTSADEMLALYELAQGLAGQVSVSHAAEMIGRHLKPLIPCSLIVWYIHNRESGELEVRHALGEGASAIRGLKIPLGQRLSGWVAANRQTIVNSDAALDIGDLARPQALGLKSCISTALVSNDQLVGVLSLYSSDANGFNDDHRRIIETVARQIAYTFECAVEFESVTRRDELTGLPPITQLEKVLEASFANSEPDKYALVFIDVIGFTDLNSRFGRAAGDEVLRHVARHARSALRIGDILFRHAGDEFVGLLSDVDSKTAESISERITSNIRSHPVLWSGTQLTISATAVAVCCPRDGRCFGDLVRAARPTRATVARPEGSRIH
jgi:diguanylate cyclase (GGDEF)-like protein